MRLLMLMLLGVLCAGAAPASDAAGDTPKETVVKVPDVDTAKVPDLDRAPPRKADPGRSDDLVTCKRDAVGMHGPARGRFMTECIRKR